MFSSVITDFPRTNLFICYYYFGFLLCLIYVINLLSLGEIFVIVYKETQIVKTENKIFHDLFLHTIVTTVMTFVFYSYLEVLSVVFVLIFLNDELIKGERIVLWLVLPVTLNTVNIAASLVLGLFKIWVMKRMAKIRD